MLNSCTSLTTLDVSSWDVSSVTNMGYMFHNCLSLTTLDVSNWDVSSVTNLGYMFRYCSSLIGLDPQDWDINQVLAFTDFATDVTISTVNYDALLVKWEAQAPLTGKSINFGGSKYTAGSAAETARASLISTYGWTITDGGPA